MDSLLLWMGRFAGVAGGLMTAWAVAARLTGAYFAGGFQIGTLLLAGMTGVLFGCFCLLVLLTRRHRA